MTQDQSANNIQKINEIDEIKVEKDHLIVILVLAFIGSSCLTIVIVLMVRYCRKRAKKQRIQKNEIKQETERPSDILEGTHMKLKFEHDVQNLKLIKSEEQDSAVYESAAYKMAFQESTEQILVRGSICKPGFILKPEDIVSSNQSDPQNDYEFVSSRKNQQQPTLQHVTKLDKTSSIGENINNTISDEFLEQITDLKDIRNQQVFLQGNSTADVIKTARHEHDQIRVLNDFAEGQDLKKSKNFTTSRFISKQGLDSSQNIRKSSLHDQISHMNKKSQAINNLNEENEGSNVIELAERTQEVNNIGKIQMINKSSTQDIDVFKDQSNMEQKQHQSSFDRRFNRVATNRDFNRSRRKSSNSRSPTSQRSPISPRSPTSQGGTNKRILGRKLNQNSQFQSMDQSFSEPSDERGINHVQPSGPINQISNPLESDVNANESIRMMQPQSRINSQSNDLQIQQSNLKNRSSKEFEFQPQNIKYTSSKDLKIMQSNRMYAQSNELNILKIEEDSETSNDLNEQIQHDHIRQQDIQQKLQRQLQQQINESKLLNQKYDLSASNELIQNQQISDNQVMQNKSRQILNDKNQSPRDSKPQSLINQNKILKTAKQPQIDLDSNNNLNLNNFQPSQAQIDPQSNEDYRRHILSNEQIQLKQQVEQSDQILQNDQNCKLNQNLFTKSDKQLIQLPKDMNLIQNNNTQIIQHNLPQVNLQQNQFFDQNMNEQVEHFIDLNGQIKNIILEKQSLVNDSMLSETQRQNIQAINQSSNDALYVMEQDQLVDNVLPIPQIQSANNFNNQFSNMQSNGNNDDKDVTVVDFMNQNKSSERMNNALDSKRSKQNELNRDQGIQKANQGLIKLYQKSQNLDTQVNNINQQLDTFEQKNDQNQIENYSKNNQPEQKEIEDFQIKNNMLKAAQPQNSAQRLFQDTSIQQMTKNMVIDQPFPEIQVNKQDVSNFILSENDSASQQMSKQILLQKIEYHDNDIYQNNLDEDQKIQDNVPVKQLTQDKQKLEDLLQRTPIMSPRDLIQERVQPKSDQKKKAKMKEKLKEKVGQKVKEKMKEKSQEKVKKNVKEKINQQIKSNIQSFVQDQLRDKLKKSFRDKFDKKPIQKLQNESEHTDLNDQKEQNQEADKKLPQIISVTNLPTNEMNTFNDFDKMIYQQKDSILEKHNDQAQVNDDFVYATFSKKKKVKSKTRNSPKQIDINDFSNFYQLDDYVPPPKIEQKLQIQTEPDQRLTPKSPNHLLLRGGMFQSRSDLQYKSPDLPPSIATPLPTVEELYQIPEQKPLEEDYYYQKFGFDIAQGNSFNTSNFRLDKFANTNLTPREFQTLDQLEIAENQLASLFGGIHSKSPVRTNMTLTPAARGTQSKKIDLSMSEKKKRSIRNRFYTNKYTANVDGGNTPNSQNMFMPAELIAERGRQLFQNPPLSNCKFHENERNKTANMDKRDRIGAESPDMNNRPVTQHLIGQSKDQNHVNNSKKKSKIQKIQQLDLDIELEFIKSQIDF